MSFVLRSLRSLRPSVASLPSLGYEQVSSCQLCYFAKSIVPTLRLPAHILTPLSLAPFMGGQGWALIWAQPTLIFGYIVHSLHRRSCVTSLHLCSVALCISFVMHRNSSFFLLRTVRPSRQT